MAKGKRKEEKRDILINTAKDVFLKKGLFNVVMDDIAKEVGITRRNLYYYFKTKEDLVYETAILLLGEWKEYHEEVFKTLQGSGIDQVHMFLNRLIEYMESRIEVMKFMSEFDFYFSDERRREPSEDCVKRFNDIILKQDDLITILIDKGIEDGTIKEETDSKLMTNIINNVLWSFGQSLAIRGDKIEQESGMQGIDLIKNQALLYVLALQKS